MAFDDPVVWVLIIAVVVFLFGAGKIPQFARGLGQAKKEFEMASKGLTQPMNVVKDEILAPSTGPSTSSAVPQETTASVAADPLVLAAQKEGIDTSGKTRDQIASELAWSLKKKSA